MTQKCKSCKHEWYSDTPWLMQFICPKCGSTDTEEIKAWTTQVNTKYTYPGDRLYDWCQRVKSKIPPKES